VVEDEQERTELEKLVELVYQDGRSVGPCKDEEEYPETSESLEDGLPPGTRPKGYMLVVLCVRAPFLAKSRTREGSYVWCEHAGTFIRPGVGDLEHVVSPEFVGLFVVGGEHDVGCQHAVLGSR
jgi:hypothetical protein